MLGLDFLCVYLGFVFGVFFYVSLGHFVLVLLAFVVLGLVSSVLSQEIGWEERLRNDLFCVEWDVKPQPQLNQFNIRVPTGLDFFLSFSWSEKSGKQVRSLKVLEFNL